MTLRRPRRQFSEDTIADLTRLLRDHDPAQTIAALQKVVDRFPDRKHIERTKAELTSRARSWSKGLHQRLTEIQAYVHSLEHRDEAVMFTGSSLDQSGRDQLMQTLQPFIDAAAIERDHHVTPPGTPTLPRFLLNLELALVLQHAGVPLRKSRQGVAHRIFVEVYTSLGLTKKGGDVFHALEQGLTLVRQGIRVRVKKSAPILP